MPTITTTNELDELLDELAGPDPATVRAAIDAGLAAARIAGCVLIAPRATHESTIREVAR